MFIPVAYCLSLYLFILVCILTLSSWSIFSNIYTLTKPVNQFFFKSFWFSNDCLPLEIMAALSRTARGQTLARVSSVSLSEMGEKWPAGWRTRPSPPLSVQEYQS